MRHIITLLLLGCLALGASAHSVNGGVITGVSVSNDSLSKHFTSKYRLEKGFVVRRGFPFTVEVTTKEALADGQTIHVEVPNDLTSTSRRHPFFDLKFNGKRKNDENKYELELSTTATSDIAKFENIPVSVVDKDGKTVETFTFEGPLYVIFNPYNEHDQVYVGNATKRQEYLENEYGKIFNGWADNYFSYKWFYAQYDELTIFAAFHVLSGMEGNKSSIFEVGRYLSMNQGWYPDDATGKITGNKELGLVEGRWSDDKRIYPGGTDPEDWVSTRDLLIEWRDKKRAAKYGQCYIYGALQNSIMRALGVASRQLSAFDARIDQSKNFYSDKKQHHVINKYFTKNGDMVKNEGQIWNFHSWNDLWLHDVMGQKEGWCALDGTPPGTKAGPGPVPLVYQLKEDSHTITDMISTTKSAERHILVECESKEMCDMKKIIKFDPRGCRKIVTSLPLGDGEQTITFDYIDPEANAYIDVPHDPWHPDEPKDPKGPEDKEIVHMDVKIDIPTGIVVGDDIEGKATLHLRRTPLADNASSNKADITVDINVVADMQGQRGDVLREFARISKSVVLAADQDEHAVTFPIQITADSYLKRQKQVSPFMELRALAAARDLDLAAIDTAKIHVLAPEPRLRLVDSDSEGVIAVQLELQNPHYFPIDICGSLHTPYLEHMHGSARGSDTAIICKTVGAKVAHSATFLVRVPQNTARAAHTLIAKVTGDYMPTRIQHLDIEIEPTVSVPEALLEAEVGAAEMAAIRLSVPAPQAHRLKAN